MTPIISCYHGKVIINFLNRLKPITVYPMKPLTPETISGMFIVSQPVTCDMEVRKITDKLQQGSVMT